MSKILINKDSVKYLLEKFFDENPNFTKKEIRYSQTKIICKIGIYLQVLTMIK